MPIDVEWQDEHGQPLKRYEGRKIDHRFLERAPIESVCLRFIDPYGDTTFNAAQVAVLEKELAALSSGGDEIAEQAMSLLAFMKQFVDRTHCYLKFIGD